MDVEKLIDYDNFSDFVIEDLRALLTQGTGGNFPPQEGLVEKEGASAWLDYFRPRTCRKKLRKAEMDLYQNFRFGTPTRTWYSLSSPEGNDFAS